MSYMWNGKTIIICLTAGWIKKHCKKWFNAFLNHMNLLEEASLLNLFKMALFGAAHSIFAPPTIFFPKICQAYPTIMKLGTTTLPLKKMQKIYEWRDTPI